MLKDNGINWEGRVFISDRAHIILPKYRQMDKDRDAARKRPIGTTGRGIGITYAEKAERDELVKFIRESKRGIIKPYESVSKEE
jgi:adenylosuccinate synthase